MGLGDKIEAAVEKIDEKVEKVTKPEYLDQHNGKVPETNEQFDPAYASQNPKPGNADIASFEPAYGGASDSAPGTEATKDCAY